jgi:DNA replication protein DnaC
MEQRRRTLIYGPAGEGKSTVAACYLREGIERGESVAFVLARDLQDDAEGRALHDRVANADKLVLDDLGGETQGARIGGDVAAIRSKLTVQLLLHRFGHKLDTVMTFGRPMAALADLYDAGVARRILDGALQLPLGSFD